MPHLDGNIYDPERNEFYPRETTQCDKCNNKAVKDGLCEDCWLDKFENDLELKAEELDV